MSTKTEIIVWHPVSENYPTTTPPSCCRTPSKMNPCGWAITMMALGTKCKAVCCRNALSRTGPTCPWGFE